MMARKKRRAKNEWSGLFADSKVFFFALIYRGRCVCIMDLAKQLPTKVGTQPVEQQRLLDYCFGLKARCERIIRIDADTRS